MDDPKRPSDLFPAIGPILRDMIKREGFSMQKYAALIGMPYASLSRNLHRRDLRWSTINRIVYPLGYHLVIKRKGTKDHYVPKPVYEQMDPIERGMFWRWKRRKRIKEGKE
jgi:hypothetical protein